MKNIILAIILFSFVFQLNGQEDNIEKEKPYYADFMVGPYLILDGTIYESVFLTGIRIGYEFDNRFATGIEYMVGNQEDLQGELGTTHSAFGYIKYFTKNRNGESRFRPYFLAGGGFFEFKDFSADVLGVSFYLGAAAELNFSNNIKGFAEGRYVNLGLLDADGTHQLGVIWGVRVRF